MLDIATGTHSPRGPMFAPAQAHRPDEVRTPSKKRASQSYDQQRFDEHFVEQQHDFGGAAYAPAVAPTSHVKLPFQHDVLHHEGSEMRVEANPAALGALTHTLTAGPVLGAAIAAGTALLSRGPKAS